MASPAADLGDPARSEPDRTAVVKAAAAFAAAGVAGALLVLVALVALAVAPLTRQEARRPRV